jgi:hypothetical protein
VIIYTPVDISIELPDPFKLREYVLANQLINLKETTGYESIITPVASINDVDDWRDAKQIFKDDQDLNNELVYAPGILDQFPVFKTIMDSLPFVKSIAAVLNLHTTVLPEHQDTVIDSSDPASPERYNVLLTPHFGQDSFFISPTKSNSRIYPTILEKYPIYAFNNKDIYHGADPVLNNRIIMICAGLINHEQHKELIKTSAEKFKEYVIRH